MRHYHDWNLRFRDEEYAPVTIQGTQYLLRKMYSRFRVSFKLKFKARLLIKELGNDDKDGHFVLGFSDGNGPEISNIEITYLILDTVSNSMMILKII